ncbi:MAG: hypothetical protein WBA97_26835 [Actinophytocola sp.]|uniref:hypothetical protein n=1 Tax=Actinophytocola sp. TaxID=1872138 RepID=UPI003C751E9A
MAEHTRMVDSILDDVLPDVLNTVYGLPEPMPVIRLAESVWTACAEAFYLDELDPTAVTRWREGVGADLRRLLGELAEFGAVELTVAQPDPMYRADLDSDEPGPLSPDAWDRLRAALAPDAGPVELVSIRPAGGGISNAISGRETWPSGTACCWTGCLTTTPMTCSTR